MSATVPVVQFVVRGQEQVVAQLEERPYAVIYDGNCTVCGRLVKVLRAWDRKSMLAIAPSQTPGIHARFPWIPAKAYTQSVQVIGPGGKTWQGAAAIEQLLDVLPKGKLISWIFSIPFMRPLADRFYKWFARNRYKMGCGEHCTVRPQDLDFHDA